MRRLRIRRATVGEARRQAAWIAAIEPWHSLGYTAAGLGRWLAREAADEHVRVATEGPAVLGLAVVEPGVLLGSFVALLAVRPEAEGQGVGRSLMIDTERRTFSKRRWLYVSFDSRNRAAGRFYRRLGYRQVGTLPDLVARGRTERLLRKGRPLR